MILQKLNGGSNSADYSPNEGVHLTEISTKINSPVDGEDNSSGEQVVK